MKKGVISIAAIFIIIISACTTSKAPPSPEIMPEERDFNFYLRQGAMSLDSSDYEKAIEQFRKAIALRPDSSKTYNLLGIAYFDQKNYKLAKKQFERAVVINSSYAEAYNNLGSVYFMTGQFKEAEKMLTKALSMSSNLVSANYNLGALLLAQGKIEEGTPYLSKGIALDPDYVEKHKAFATNISSPFFNTSEMFFIYAKLYASIGNIEKTVEYLKEAEGAGFNDWHRIMKEKDFEKVREDPRIKDFLKRKIQRTPMVKHAEGILSRYSLCDETKILRGGINEIKV